MIHVDMWDKTQKDPIAINTRLAALPPIRSVVKHNDVEYLVTEVIQETGRDTVSLFVTKHHLTREYTENKNG